MSIARVRPALLNACLISFLCLAFATAACAAPTTRNFDYRLEGLTPPSAPVQGPFAGPWGVAIGSSDDLWVSDPDIGAIFEYDSLGGYLTQRPLGATRDFAVNASTGALYEHSGEAGEEAIRIYDASGTQTGHIEVGYSGCGEVGVAVDNSGGPTQGTVYSAYNCTPETVRAYAPNGSPRDFSASASYINGNEILGTPSESFTGGIRFVATDSHGDIYVPNPGPHTVDEFAPSGLFVREFTGSEIPGGGFSPVAVAVDPTDGNVLISDGEHENGSGENDTQIDEFTEIGGFIGHVAAPMPDGAFPGRSNVQGLAVDSKGYLYVAYSPENEPAPPGVYVFLPTGLGPLPEASAAAATEVARTTAALHGSAAPGEGGPVSSCQFEYAPEPEYEPFGDHPYAKGAAAPCLNAAGNRVGTPSEPITEETEVHAPVSAILAGSKYHVRVAVTNSEEIPRYSSDETFETLPAVTDLKTEPPTELTQKSAKLMGSFTAEESLETHFFFEYGTSSNFGHTTAISSTPGTSSGTETRVVGISVTEPELVPDTTYHFRIVAENSFGKTAGPEAEFTTFQPPTVNGVSSSHLALTSANLEANVEPHGFETHCRFEYGTSTAYGQLASCPAALEGSGAEHVVVPLEGLQSGVTYHFRVIAENQWGSVTSEDHSFSFLPPICPNEAVRQQTGASYLPDCRAYELVSPGNANGTMLYPGGPNTGLASSPSRFAFVGAFSALPGESVIDTLGDLYVATRTDAGWVTHYIGLSGDEAGCVGSPPNDPWSRDGSSPSQVQDEVPTDPEMNEFLDFVDGAPALCRTDGSGVGDATNPLAHPSNVGYLWKADGSSLGRMPTDLESLPGAAEALNCAIDSESVTDPSLCTSEIAASGDLTHVFFSTSKIAFAEGGLTEAPGSAYDDDLATGEITLISKLSGGEPIPQDPSYAKVPPAVHAVGGKEEFIRFPAVSSDGSHVLMSTATSQTPQCNNEQGGPFCVRFSETPIHLYMSIDDRAAIPIAEGNAVNYIGMTPDGTKVYFTSEEHLTGENEGHRGTSLFMWSQRGQEEGHPLTLISKANPGSTATAGNTGDCAPREEWTTKCSVVPYSGWSYAAAPGALGGNGSSDSTLAANGDIYFFSPEQLDGDRGVLGNENLYDYREGRLQFVASFAPETTCIPSGFEEEHPESKCSSTAIARMEITPDDTHMAFVTSDQVTTYDNVDPHGSCQKTLRGQPTGETHCTEMYSYTPTTGAIVCDSCNPNGHPPTSDVFASQDGLFLTNDGRTFFTTNESLAPEDTNEGLDVYEFVEGAPHLITPGTGTASFGGVSLSAREQKPGLAGVSADGTDVFFSTYDTLTAEDHNGNFLKFYDARTSGGFPQSAPAQPCAAAEECHGPGTEEPPHAQRGTLAVLHGGNVSRARHKRHHETRTHHKPRRRHHHRFPAHRSRR